MGHSRTIIAAGAFLLVLFCGLCFAWEATVVGVKDGDTIVVWDGKEQTTIRLEGVDAPEHNQAFGEKAKQFTSSMVFGKKVRIDGKQKDKYGRTIGEVYVGDKSLNDELLIAGFAWHYKQYSKSTNKANAETVARALKHGLWADSKPIPPWEFRHEKDHKQKSSDDMSPENQKEYERALKAAGEEGSSQSNTAGSGSTDGSTSSSTTYTGPRGGQYHYSASGNKVYQKRR